MATTETAGPLAADELERLDAFWRAANYLSVGQIFLLDNPLLREPLRLEHIKPRLLGHWGTTPGLNFIYAHLNRVIAARELSAIYVAGPGHGGPGLVASTWLEGSYSEIYPNISQDEEGMQRLFRQFSFPGGIPSHVAPETPGSIHEGGELARARLWRGVRQPGPAGGLRRRRRRGRDGPAGRELARQQVPRPGARRRGAAATTWSSTSSTACPRSGSEPPCCASRWSTSGWRSAPIRARARRRPAGAARLDVAGRLTVCGRVRIGARTPTVEPAPPGREHRGMPTHLLTGPNVRMEPVGIPVPPNPSPAPDA